MMLEGTYGDGDGVVKYHRGEGLHANNTPEDTEAYSVRKTWGCAPWCSWARILPTTACKDKLSLLVPHVLHISDILGNRLGDSLPISPAPSILAKNLSAGDSNKNDIRRNLVEFKNAWSLRALDSSIAISSASQDQNLHTGN